MQKIFEDYENHSLGLDDTFRFKCRGCGKCCKNRDDILLTARDLHNIARDLGITAAETVNRYCESYIGGTSRIPVVRLRSRGPEKACPLLWNRRCKVHRAKPVVCALFPLGRAYAGPAGSGAGGSPSEIGPRYFVQSAACGSQAHTHTVRSWLEKFGIPAEDDFYVLWNETVMFLSDYFRGLEEKKTPDHILERLRDITFVTLYIGFDPNLDLVPQFRKNAAKLKDCLLKLKAMAGGALDGK
jgi:Fe-S-cluster containining protein